MAPARKPYSAFWGRDGGRPVILTRRKNGMFSHIMIGSNDIARSKKFYDAIFGVLGVSPATPDGRGRLAYAHNGGRFMVTEPIDNKPATAANGGTIGFLMNSAEQAA